MEALERFPVSSEGKTGPPAMTFEDYRQMCDQNSPSSYRQLGILEPDSYDEAVNDPRTVFNEAGDSSVPILTPIDNVPGYDSERCKELTGSDDVMLLCVPPAVLRDTEGAADSTNNSPIILELPDAPEVLRQDVASNLSRRLGQGFQIRDFVDDTVDDPAHETADIRMFAASAKPVGETGEEPTSLEYAWKKIAGDREALDEDPERTMFFTAEDIKNNEGLVAELWEICESRFSFLGSHHPVSMEESKEFFEKLLFGKDTYTVVRFHEDKPACFGFFIHGMRECDWISSDFIQEQEKVAEQNGEQLLYFPEIMTKEEGAQFAGDVIALHAELAHEANISYRLLFESTNRSAIYVPRLIKQYLEKTGLIDMEEIQKIAEMTYSWLEPVTDAPGEETKTA